MNDGFISDYCLERYFLGEVSSKEAGEVERLAAANPRFQAALNGIEFSNRDILAIYPPKSFKTDLLTRLKNADDGRPIRSLRSLFPSAEFHWKRSLALASAVAVLVLGAVLVIPVIKERVGSIPSSPGIDQVLVKGNGNVDLGKTQLLVYRKRGDLAEILTDGNTAEAGSLLQLAYISAAEPFGIILSIDGRGGITRHFPAEESESPILSLNKKEFLPNAIELDDAPGFERFFLVTSMLPIDISDVFSLAEKLAKDPALAQYAQLDLPPGLKQRSVLILKGECAR